MLGWRRRGFWVFWAGGARCARTEGSKFFGARPRSLTFLPFIRLFFATTPSVHSFAANFIAFTQKEFIFIFGGFWVFWAGFVFQAGLWNTPKQAVVLILLGSAFELNLLFILGF